MRLRLLWLSLLLTTALAVTAPSSPSQAANELGEGICETTTSTGTGTVNLEGALTGGYSTFVSQIASGNSVPYRIVTGSGASRKIETGRGTFTDGAPDTFTRDASWTTDDQTAPIDELNISGTSTVCLAINQGLLEGDKGDITFSDGFMSALIDTDAVDADAIGVDAVGSSELNGADVEAEIESIIDTLPNLTSIQSRTITLTDAGFDAFLGWDDTAGAYENLVPAEAAEILCGTDPNVDRILFWDDSAPRCQYLTVQGLSISGTTGTITQSFVMAASDETTVITSGADKATFRVPYAFTVTGVRCNLNVGQTGGSLFTVDINENNTSILGTKITIDNNETTSVTAATAATITDTSLADDAEIEIDVDTVGTGSPAGLKCAVIGYRT